MFSTLEVEGSDALRVVRYRGSEALSELFLFEVWVTSGDVHLKFADFVGKKATLVFGDPSAAGRKLHGMVRRFELAHQTGGRASYRFELVPQAHRLTLTNDCRIFQHESAPQIIQQVLGGFAIESVTASLGGSYATREYCVQYRESDWDFVSRLMEEEGIFYWFEHGDGDAKLVLGDGKSAHNPIAGEATITFRPAAGALGDAHEHVTRLCFGEEVRPGKVTLRDYNFLKPRLALEGESAASVDSDLEIYDYPAKFDEPGAGKSRAARWLEARQASRQSGDGESTVLRFMAGQTFTLGDNAEDDLRDDLNIEYLLTRVEHRGAEPGYADMAEAEAYSNRFWVIPSAVPFRPGQRTPKPRVHGAQTAVVVGPGGEEIHTDEHGRIKVQFHWDRLGKNDENSSCWVRVQQPWAGPGWGTLFIPRIGQEVVVEFLEGDPDRPLVSGAVYHAANVPPYALPGEKTKSTIKSDSSIGGGGFNELRFEDRKGSEEIFLHGQKDWVIVIENDKAQLIKHDEFSKVDHDRTREVGRHETVHVGGNRQKTVDGDEEVIVGGNETITVGKNHAEKIGGNESIEVGGSETLGVSGNRTASIGGNHVEAVVLNHNTAVGGMFAQEVLLDHTVVVGTNASMTVRKNQTIQVNKDRTAQIKEKDTENVGKEKTIIVGDKITIQCGDSNVTIEKNGKITISGKDINVKADGPIKVEGKKLDVKSEGAVKVNASGKIEVKGSNVKIN
jgi:type VI secretion system secreted protein VgrG